MQPRYHVPEQHPELERLICAAMSNQRLAQQLLTAPADALARSGHRLSPDERNIVISIRGAADIHDFAARLHAKVNHL